MRALEHVVWIGGPPGSGKTTVALRIARRHGLRWYNSDAHTWEHRERAVRAGVLEAIRFESMTMEERKALPVEEHLAMALQRERGPMTIDDLRALPSTPLTVAEGTQVTPSMLPPGSRALWLMLSPRTQRARLKERHKPRPVPELYLRLGELIAAEVKAAKVPRLVVDELTIDETVTAVEQFFAEAMAEGPRAQTAQERRALLRYANLADVVRYQRVYKRPWNTGDIRNATHAFVCECADPECAALVERAVVDFPERPLLAVGHQGVEEGI